MVIVGAVTDRRPYADSLTPAQRSLRGRIGAYRQQSLHDPREMTSKARAAAWLKFLEAADPDHVLSDAERQRRAEALRREHMARAAWKSSRARAENARRRRPASP